MNRYFIRAVKYFLWLTVLFVVLFAFMLATGTARVGLAEGLHELLYTTRGLLLLCVVIVLSVSYPKFGFVKKEFAANIASDRDKIIKAFETSGFVLDKESLDRMEFRAAKGIRRAFLLWEDRIIVTADGNNIQIEGIRKEVVRIDYRLRAFLGE